MPYPVFSRRAGATARVVFVALLAFTMAGAALAAPSGVAAAPHDRGPQAGADDPGSNPGPYRSGENTGDPGNGSGVGGAAATVTGDLNLRSGPGVDAAIVAVMPAGSVVEITGDPENGFYPVNYDGMTGYASADYLGIGGNGADATSGEVDTSGTADSPSAAPAAGGDIVSIIYAAAAYYGQSGDDMLRVAICESGLDPNNVTPPYDASGLFQFLPGTWASTPYAAQSVFDPVANAYAAAWMWAVGRRGEWVCQ